MNILLPKRSFLWWLNRSLLVAIVTINGYVITKPFLPMITYRTAQATSRPLDPTKPDSLASVSRQNNHILIPRLRLDHPIWSSPQSSALSKGIWHQSTTSSPGQGGNTVLAGHRFTYDGPSVLYNLDKVQIGDSVIVVWKHKLYVYRVSNIKTVLPSAVEIKAPTTREQLTIYTCTPMWSFKKRLVVVANLERVV